MTTTQKLRFAATSAALTAVLTVTLGATSTTTALASRPHPGGGPTTSERLDIGLVVAERKAAAAAYFVEHALELSASR